MASPQHDGDQEAEPGANGVCINLRFLQGQGQAASFGACQLIWERMDLYIKHARAIPGGTSAYKQDMHSLDVFSQRFLIQALLLNTASFTIRYENEEPTSKLTTSCWCVSAKVWTGFSAL